MTKSRIALSKINRSALVQSSSRPFNFHRTAARFEPKKNAPGNTRSRSTADEQSNRVLQCVKRKSWRGRIFFAPWNAFARGNQKYREPSDYRASSLKPIRVRQFGAEKRTFAYGTKALTGSG